MPKIEIERKFLLKSLPVISPDKSIKIDQFYLKNSKGIWERIRKWEVGGDIKYIHTIKKSISKLENIEDETEVSEDFYLLFKSKCESSKDSRFIKKTRHIFPYGELIWEIDEFHNDYKLIIGEIEIPKKDYKLQIPKYIKDLVLLEVSGMSQFSNRNLSLSIN